MKVTDKNTEKKRKIKKKPIVKPKKQQVLVVAQEIKFARLLSGNEKKTRDRVLKALKKWLVNCFEKNYEFKEDDFTRVWKGLFYAVWMSDKPLVQEDLCESIAGILDLFPEEQLSGAMLLTKAGFKMLATEWFGIDQHRIDKFLMLVRRYLRGSLRCVHRCGWGEDACSMFADMLSSKDGILALQTPIYARNATSMIVHIADCYLEEISKVSSGKVPPDSLCVLLRPFLAYLAQGASAPVCVAARRVLSELLRHGDPEDGDDSEQESDAEEDEAIENNRIQQNGDADSDDEITDGPLDPRAGRVDVALCPLPVPAPQLASSLRQLLSRATGAGHRRARRCIQLLEQFSSGSHPFTPPAPDIEPGPSIKLTKTAKALRALEKKLVANGDELALRGLSRKHRKRLLAKARAGLSIVDDVPRPRSKRKPKLPNTTNGEWQVEDAEVIKAKSKRKRGSKDNEAEPKNKKRKLNTESGTETEANKLKNKIKKQKNNVKNDVNGKNVKDIKNIAKEKSVKDISVKHKDIVKMKNSVKEIRNNVNVKNNVNAIKNNINVKNNVKEIRNNVKVKHVVTLQNSVNVVNNSGNVKENGVNIKPVKKEKINKKAKVNVDKKDSTESEAVFKYSLNLNTPKKVKFALKNNSMQGTLDYYKSIRESPSIPFDSNRKPSKTNLKPSTPSPINPFFKKKMTRRASFSAQIVY